MELFSYLLGKSQGGGSTVTLQEKNVLISQNGESTIEPDEGYDGLSSVNLTTNVSGELDWDSIGYSYTPKSIVDAYNFTKNIYNTWDATATDYRLKYGEQTTGLLYFPAVNTSAGTVFRQMFYNCPNLEEVASINTSNGEYFQNMFYGCRSLKYVPVMNLGKALNLNSMFYQCEQLTDESLNNILESCTTVTETYTRTKTLSELGLNSSVYSTRITNLSNYQDFLDAGWTAGW